MSPCADCPRYAEVFLHCPTPCQPQIPAAGMSPWPRLSPGMSLELEQPWQRLWRWWLLLCADRPWASPPLPRGCPWVRCWVTPAGKAPDWQDPEPGHRAAPGHCQLSVQGSSGRAGSAHVPAGGTDKQGHSALLALCIFTQLNKKTQKNVVFSPQF